MISDQMRIWILWGISFSASSLKI